MKFELTTEWGGGADGVAGGDQAEVQRSETANRPAAAILGPNPSSRFAGLAMRRTEGGQGARWPGHRKERRRRSWEWEDGRRRK